MAERTCTVDGCSQPHLARGFCRAHYDAERRGSSPVNRTRRFLGLPRATTRAEFVSLRFEVTDTGCWDWIGSLKKAKGYGVATWRGKSGPAHRVAWEEFVGPIPSGLDLDHLCRNRACINPDHLEPVTRLVNNRRKTPEARLAAGRVQRAKTHCPQGHPYDEANTATYPTRSGIRRYCIACRNARNAARLAAEKAQRA